jgi:hypothetical protein
MLEKAQTPSVGRPWQVNKAWADSYVPQVREVVRSVAGQIVRLLVAPTEVDVHDGADYIVGVPSGDIACRIRRETWKGWRRDLTLRCQVASGGPTEVDKLRGETVRWYLYAWADENGFVDWMFVDLARVRQARLIDLAIQYGQVVELPDETSFLWISADDLFFVGAIVKATFGPSAPLVGQEW